MTFCFYYTMKMRFHLKNFTIYILNSTCSFFFLSYENKEILIGFFRINDDIIVGNDIDKGRNDSLLCAIVENKKKTFENFILRHIRLKERRCQKT